MKRELDSRMSNGLEVRLLWHPETNAVAVEVFDWSTGEEFELPVEGARALDAFHHPFAYAA